MDVNFSDQTTTNLFNYDQVLLTKESRSIHIRLAYLSGIEPDNPSSISLEPKLAPIDGETKKFVALSYCWGDDKPTVPIAVNNSGRLLVTPSLSHAILHLRRRETIRLLPIWIDQICIDQASKDEQSAQVPLIGKIYKRAVEVFI